jgi:hypothetical protein
VHIAASVDQHFSVNCFTEGWLRHYCGHMLRLWLLDFAV